MRYIIIFNDQSCFYTSWYDYENNYNPDVMFMIVDVYEHKYSINGKDFLDIPEDHL